MTKFHYAGSFTTSGCGLSKVKEGCLADVILVDGDPLKDIAVLQELNVITINGRIHKVLHREFAKTLESPSPYDCSNDELRCLQRWSRPIPCGSSQFG